MPVLASCMTWRSQGWSFCLSVGCLLHGRHIGVQAGHDTWLGPVVLHWPAGSNVALCIWSLAVRHLVDVLWAPLLTHMYLELHSGLCWWSLQQVWQCRLYRLCCIYVTQDLAHRHLSGALWAWVVHRHLVVEVLYVHRSVGHCLTHLLPYTA